MHIYGLLDQRSPPILGQIIYILCLNPIGEISFQFLRGWVAQRLGIVAFRKTLSHLWSIFKLLSCKKTCQPLVLLFLIFYYKKKKKPTSSISIFWENQRMWDVKSQFGYIAHGLWIIKEATMSAPNNAKRRDDHVQPVGLQY